MAVIITGGSGYLGQHLALALSQNGYEARSDGFVGNDELLVETWHDHLAIIRHGTRCWRPTIEMAIIGTHRGGFAGFR